MGALHRLDFRNLDIAPNSVDLVFSDPPFGVGYQNPYTHEKHEVLIGDGAPFDYGELARHSYTMLKNDRALLLFTGWSTCPTLLSD